MKYWVLLLGFVFLAAGCASVVNEPPRVAEMNEQGYKQIVEDDFSFQWKIVGDQLDCTVRGKTEGWVSVGFNTVKPKMDKSNFIIGYILDGELKIEDQIAKGWGHRADVQQDIITASGEEKNGQTMMRFSIPLHDDGNHQDMTLVVGEIVYVLLAIGPKDDYRSYHKSKTVLKIKL